MRYRRFGRTELQVSAVSLGGLIYAGMIRTGRRKMRGRWWGGHWIWGVIILILHRFMGRARPCSAGHWRGRRGLFIWRQKWGSNPRALIIGAIRFCGV